MDAETIVAIPPTVIDEIARPLRLSKPWSAVGTSPLLQCHVDPGMRWVPSLSRPSWGKAAKMTSTYDDLRGSGWKIISVK